MNIFFSATSSRLIVASAMALVIAGCSTTTPAPVLDRTTRSDGRALPQPVATAPAPIFDRTAPPSSAQSSGATTTSGAPAGTIVSVTPIGPGTPLPPGTPLGGTSAIRAPSAGDGSLTVLGNTAGSQFHVVQKSENLYRIALNNGINIDNLAAWNGITPTTPIREGQVLRLRPADGSAPPVPGAPGQPMLVPPNGSVLPGAPLSVTPINTSPMPTVPSSAPLRSDPRSQRQPFSDGALAQMQREAAGTSAATSAVPSAPPPPSSQLSTPTGSVVTPSVGGAPLIVNPPVAAAPKIESEIRPGAGIDREGVAWSWPTAGRVASKFNDKAAMKGIDISANIGTPVVAAAAGKVIYVGKEPRGFGQMVVVSHAKETVSVYFHTEKVLVKEQQRVTLGQRLAEVGETSGSKMHFEVRRQGRPVDPIALMPNL